MRPAGGGIRLAYGAQLRHLLLGKGGEPSAAHALHHHHLQSVTADDLHLAFGVLQLPVQVIELDLHKIEYALVSCQEFVDGGRRNGVRAESEMTDLPQLLLLFEIADDVELGVVVYRDRFLVDIVEQVEIEKVCSALLKLLMKNAVHRGIRPSRQPADEAEHAVSLLFHHVAGEFAGQKIAVPRILFQRLADKGLRLPRVIAVGRVVIIDPVAHGVIDDLPGFFPVDLFSLPLDRGETHVAHSESGHLYAGYFLVIHFRPSCSAAVLPPNSSSFSCSP